MVAFLVALALGADAGEAAGAAPADPAPSLALRGHVEWISAAGGSLYRDTPVNPANRVLELPQVAGETELRPHLVAEYGATVRVVARPRLLVQATRAAVGGGWRPERSDASATWTELYAAWRLDDRVAIAYGLQNFQWGPAELISPSNRIFHETGFSRDPLYAVRGKHLARVNVSFAGAWTAVLLAEVAPNGEPAFVAAEPFEPKAQLKVEYAVPRGGGYAGVTGGAAQRSRGWFGEYAELPLWGGLSVHSDVVHTAGRRAWYPVDSGGGDVTWAQTGMESRRLRTLGVGGLRYAFEGGVDARLEYVHDDAGWSRRELRLAARAARAEVADAARLEAWLAPGFELLGRDLAYASVRVPKLPPGARTEVQVRYLRSLTDGSGAVYATATRDAGDATVLFLSATVTHGAEEGALSRLFRAAAMAGAVVTW